MAQPHSKRKQRNVAFAKHLVWDFAGNVNAAAVVIGDVDNDHDNEFVIGNVKGVMAIFKGCSSNKPWKTCHNLGTIASIVIGDILNYGRNMLVCVTAEGSCHVFDIQSDNNAWSTKETNVLDGPTLTFPLPVNVARCVIADFDGDGFNEFIVAHTDRSLNAYRFRSSNRNLDESEPALTRGSPNTARFDFQIIGNWQLPGQSGSLVLSKNVDGTPVLLIAQPGNAYVSLDYKGILHTDTAPTDVGMGYFRGGVPTELVLLPHSTSISTTNIGPGQVALVSVDGTIKMLNNDLSKLWELPVNHQLFSLSSMDIVGNGKSLVVCCSWDGLTYIVDTEQNVVRFQFPDYVCAFAAGLFAQSQGENVPSLFFVNYADQINVYPESKLDFIAMQRFSDAVAERVLPEFADKLEISSMGVRPKGSEGAFTPIADFISMLLYAE